MTDNRDRDGVRSTETEGLGCLSTAKPGPQGSPRWYRETGTAKGRMMEPKLMTDRRSMLRGAFALASFAVIPGTALALPQDDRQRLVGMLAKPGTIISGQEFHFHNGETIHFAGLRDITITDCKFVWHGPAPWPAGFDMRGCRNVTVENSVIDMGGCRPDQSSCGILLDHQS